MKSQYLWVTWTGVTCIDISFWFSHRVEKKSFCLYICQGSLSVGETDQKTSLSVGPCQVVYSSVLISGPEGKTLVAYCQTFSFFLPQSSFYRLLRERHSGMLIISACHSSEWENNLWKAELRSKEHYERTWWKVVPKCSNDQLHMYTMKNKLKEHIGRWLGFS